MSPLLLRRLSDESLGSRLAAGEAAAFDELYRRYAHRLAAYGAHLLGDAASGDDVAQAALLKAYGALRDGRIPGRVQPWLYRIAHNAAIDLVRRRRELPSPEVPDRPGEEEVDRGALVAALAELPDRQRRVYVLREIHGLRIDETARELSLTTQQVEQSLFAARNRLAELLVFGERLSCVSVQRLASGPLALDERRAMKTHLRSCTPCRSAVGRRATALALFPVSPVEWLRALPGLGGAPVAAKIGAAVATATLVTGAAAPVVRHAHRPQLQPAPRVAAHVAAVRTRAPSPAHAHAAVRRAVVAPVAVRTVRLAPAREIERRGSVRTAAAHPAAEHHHDAPRAPVEATGEPGGAGPSHGSEAPTAVAPAPEPEPEPTTSPNQGPPPAESVDQHDGPDTGPSGPGGGSGSGDGGRGGGSGSGHGGDGS